MAKIGPRFKLGDKVRWALEDGALATVVKVPTRRSRGLLFGGSYAYDIVLDVPVRGYAGPHRTNEGHLEFVRDAFCDAVPCNEYIN